MRARGLGLQQTSGKAAHLRAWAHAARASLALAMLIAVPAFAGPIPESNRIEFQVLRDGSPIGTHTLEFTRNGPRVTVRIAIDLLVRFLGIPVYRYTHRNTEVWEGDRLVSIEATTDRNGTQLAVRGQAGSGGIALESTQGGRFMAPADIVTTSYWHSRFLQGRKLDTQGGKLLEVTVTPKGEERLPGDLVARRWHVAGDLKLDIWYDLTGAWAGLRFAAEDGSTITYVRR
jgi:hypothetical protein